MDCDHKSSFGWCGIKDEGICGRVSWMLCGCGGLVFTGTIAALVMGGLFYWWAITNLY